MQIGQYILFTIYLKSCITEIQDYFTPLFADGKIPTSKFIESKEVRWWQAARKSPIGEG